MDKIALLKAKISELYNSNFSTPTDQILSFIADGNLGEGCIDLDAPRTNEHDHDLVRNIPDFRTSLIDDNGDPYPIWNESVKYLVEILQLYKKGTEIKFSETGNSFKIEDIIYGDAGNSFIFQEKWTRPWENIHNENYHQARKTDLVKNVITSTTYLQFTSEMVEDIISNIRLLMPKNSRQVYVEDLNRNFWVIGQVVSGILGFLFNDDSPLKKLMTGFSKEFVQLWENVIYLWLAAAFLSIEPCTDIHTEIFPLPNSWMEPYKKYDNIEGPEHFIIQEMAAAVLAYGQKYTHSNLILIPYIRKNNYEKNYFGKAIMPYIFFIQKSGENVGIRYASLTCDGEVFTIDPHLYEEKIYGAKEEELGYTYNFPLKNISMKDSPDMQQHKYYGGLRFSFEYDRVYLSSGKLQVENARIIAKDAIGEALKLCNNPLRIQYNLGSISFMTSAIDCQDIIITDGDAVETTNIVSIPEQGQNPTFKGYYLGDFPSTVIKSQETLVFNFVKEDSLKTISRLIKIGNFLPRDKCTIDKQFYTQQSTSNAVPTSYIYNYAVCNSQYSPIEKFNWLGGSTNQVSFSKCKFFIPAPEIMSDVRINGANGYYTHGFKYQQADYLDKKHDIIFKPSDTPEDWIKITGTVENKLREIGFNVISGFIKNNLDDQGTIQYFMAAIGLKPWEGGSSSKNKHLQNIGQNYWALNLLTHMYRYVPEDLSTIWDKNTTGETPVKTIIIKDGNRKLGRLELLGLMSKQEYAFQINNQQAFKFNGSDTWRLPELKPAYTDTYENWLQIKDQRGGFYFLDCIKLSSENQTFKTAYNVWQANKTLENQNALMDTINQLYVEPATTSLIKENLRSDAQLSGKITAMSGLWTVYDGYVNSYNREANDHPYDGSIIENYQWYDSSGEAQTGGDKYKEVAYTYFYFSNGKLVLPKFTGKYGEAGSVSKFDETFPGTDSIEDDQSIYCSKGRLVSKDIMLPMDANDIFAAYTPLTEKDLVSLDNKNTSNLWGTRHVNNFNYDNYGSWT